MRIGCVGQGFIGANYAAAFEVDGYEVVRYALEEPHRNNKDAVATCDIVFIAVPTPTTPEGFDVTAVRDALRTVGVGKIAVIKSTILPGTTNMLQEEFKDIIVLFSPEFLREKTAQEDAAHPERNIVGMPEDTERFRVAAEHVLDILPKASYSRSMSAREAELVKYAGNNFLAMKVVYANLLYELSETIGADYDTVREALGNDARIGPSHLQVVQESGHPGAKPGRGAGGHCFIKDFAAFTRYYIEQTKDVIGHTALEGIEKKNVALLRASKKDLDLLESVHGKEST